MGEEKEMQYEKYNYNNSYNNGRKHFLGKKSLIFLSFLFVLGIIFLTAFYDKIEFTSNVVSMFNANNSFAISLETNIPEIKLKGDYSKIDFDFLNGQEFVLDGKKILLDKSSNFLNLYNFSGEISFDEDSVKIIKGKVSQVYINGVPIQNEKNSKMKISLTSDTKYKSISFWEDIYIREMNFMAFGRIIIGRDTINLNHDNIIIKDLFGRFSFKNNKMFFDGKITKLDINGIDKSIKISK